MSADLTPVLMFKVTERHGVKRIHLADCRYARTAPPYVWAGAKYADQLVADLVASGAIAWHSACAHCCPNLSKALDRSREQTQ